MLPLAGSKFPESLAEFLTALRTGLEEQGVSPSDVQASGEWPHASDLLIDLTSAQISRTTTLPKSADEPQANVSIERLSISAAPLYFEKTPVHFDLRASKAEGGFARVSANVSLLQLLRTESGSVSIEARRTDLENALKTFAEEFLAKQGASVKSAQLELIDRGPQSLGFRAEITAKAFVMTARVVVTGQLDLDDQLNLRVSQLATTGDGMIASIASGFLRPRFAEIEKRTIPLANYSFAGVSLHGVRISGGDALRIEARFGV